MCVIVVNSPRPGGCSPYLRRMICICVRPLRCWLDLMVRFSVVRRSAQRGRWGNLGSRLVVEQVAWGHVECMCQFIECEKRNIGFCWLTVNKLNGSHVDVCQARKLSLTDTFLSCNFFHSQPYHGFLTSYLVLTTISDLYSWQKMGQTYITITI